MNKMISGLSRQDLLIAGALLLIAAVPSWFGVAIWHMDGYDWPDEALVTADGSLHQVAVSDHRPAMMWTFEPLGSGPDCRFDDANTAQPVTTKEPDTTYRREGGSAGDWVPAVEVADHSGSLHVTCEPVEGIEPALTVAVTEAPRLPPLLDGWPPLFLVPVTLGFLGVLALLGAVVRRR